MTTVTHRESRNWKIQYYTCIEEQLWIISFADQSLYENAVSSSQDATGERFQQATPRLILRRRLRYLVWEGHKCD